MPINPETRARLREIVTDVINDLQANDDEWREIYRALERGEKFSFISDDQKYGLLSFLKLQFAQSMTVNDIIRHLRDNGYAIVRLTAFQPKTITSEEPNDAIAL